MPLTDRIKMGPFAKYRKYSKSVSFLFLNLLFFLLFRLVPMEVHNPFVHCGAYDSSSSGYCGNKRFLFPFPIELILLQVSQRQWQ